MRRSLRVVFIGVVSVLLVLPAGSAQALNADTLVSVGSPSSPFSANKQNEPAVAIDANHPTVLAAGANDNIDMEACNAGLDNDCPFTEGVGVSGVYFSFDSGTSWVQPTFTGWSARNCVGAPGDSDPAVRAAGRPDRHVAGLFRGGPRLRWRPGGGVRAGVQERRLLVGERLPAVLREPDVELPWALGVLGV